MYRNYRMPRHKSSRNIVIRHSLCVFVLMVLIGLLSQPPFAQQEVENVAGDEAVEKKRTVNLSVELIRLYYGRGQYAEVISECHKLEQIEPGNNVAKFYRARAETKMVEMGIKPPQALPPPSQFTPIAARTPSARAPGALPTQTPGSALPAFPGLSTPASAPAPEPGFAPVLPPPAGIETPGASVAAVTPTPVPTPLATPTPYISSLALRGESAVGEKSFLSSNIGRLVLIGGGGVIFLLVVVAIVILISAKRRHKTLRTHLERAKEEVEKTPVASLSVPSSVPSPSGILPEEPSQFPGEVPEIPGAPSPTISEVPEIAEVVSSASDILPEAELEVPKEVFEIPSIPSPAVSETPEIADIVSPTPGVLPEAKPELPDIPSPTDYRDIEKPAGEIPPDLPTLDVGPQTPPPEGVELSPISFRPGVEGATPETPPLTDTEPENVISPGELPPFTEPPVTPSPEPLHVPASPTGSEPPPQPPTISIEEALGMGVSSREPPPSAETPEHKIPDAGGTSMDLDTFLFGQPEQDQEETILATPSGETQKLPIAPTSKSEQKVEREDFETLMFGGEAEQETVAVEPGTPPSTAPSDTEVYAPYAKTRILPTRESESPLPSVAGEKTADLIPPTPSLEEEVSKVKEKQTEKEAPSAKEIPSPPPVKPPIIREKKLPPKTRTLADVDSGPHVERVMPGAEFGDATPLDLKTPAPSVSAEEAEGEFHGVNLDSLQAISAETLAHAGEKDKTTPPSRKKIEERSEALFNEEFKKGREAFEKGDWKKAVHYLTVASAIKPREPEVKKMLTIARKEKRKLG